MSVWQQLLHEYVQYPEDIDIIELDSVLCRLATIYFYETEQEKADKEIERVLFDRSIAKVHMLNKEAMNETLRENLMKRIEFDKAIAQEAKEFKELFNATKQDKRRKEF